MGAIFQHQMKSVFATAVLYVWDLLKIDYSAHVQHNGVHKCGSLVCFLGTLMELHGTNKVSCVSTYIIFAEDLLIARLNVLMSTK